jgi:uncharacterized protein (DUF58 family)
VNSLLYRVRFPTVVLLLVTSLVWRHGLLFVASLIVLLTIVVTWLWERYSLERVEYHRHLSQRRAFFGEEIELTIEVVNRKILPLPWLEAQDDVPMALPIVDGEVVRTHQETRGRMTNLFSLGWYEQVRRRYRVRCDARGHFAFGPVRLRSGDLFGFTSRETVLPGEDALLVYPRVVPISRLGLPARDPFGDLRTRQWIFHDPMRTIGVREYVHGDDPRQIHWGATARTQQLQVKIPEPTTTYRLVVFLNLNTQGTHWWWPGFSPNLVELAIVTAASVANWAIEADFQVGLAVNGNWRMTDQKVRIAPSRDPEQLTHVLEALASVVPFATMPLDSLIRLESRELAYGATLVVVTAVLDEAIVAELLALKATGHRVALMLIGDDTKELSLPGIQIFRVGGEDTWRDLTEITARQSGIA